MLYSDIVYVEAMPKAPEQTALFNPFNGHLEQLFGYIDVGDLGLPDIQRPFVWKDAKVRDLFDSIYRGFPIGSYLFWRNSVAGNTHQIGIEEREHNDPVLLIIDGQQRLTALYAVFRKKKVKDENYENRNIVISFNPVSEEFKVADASTIKNPEFINNISDFLTKTSTRTFINTYLLGLQRYYQQLTQKQKNIISKIRKDGDLNQEDMAVVADKLLADGVLSDEEEIILEKFGRVSGIQENDDELNSNEEEGGDNEEMSGAIESTTLTKSEKDLLCRVLDEPVTFEEDAISERLEKLYNLKNYPFNALEIIPSLDEEKIADIFTRINSKGTVLKQADFILTLLSVFWEEGREEIDKFCQNAKKQNDKEKGDSPFNYIFEPSPKDLIRVIVGLGFKRGKMKDAYSILTGRDFVTRKTVLSLRDEQLGRFKEAQKKVLDNVTWHQFLKLLIGLGFKSSELISSSNNIANAYILFLIAKHELGLDHRELDKYIGKWFFFSSITSRYSFSPESQMDADLNYFKVARNKGEFIALLERAIDSEITSDFWEITVPNKLLVSSSKKNAIRNAFFACLIKNNTRVLFSDRTVDDLFKPEMKPKKKNLEKHHLFPKDYLSKKLKLDRTAVNQAANFTYLEFEDNIDIGGESPKKYFNEIKNTHFKGREDELFNVMREHCVPENFYDMTYDDFLKNRRNLMSQLVRKNFERV